MDRRTLLEPPAPGWRYYPGPNNSVRGWYDPRFDSYYDALDHGRQYIITRREYEERFQWHESASAIGYQERIYRDIPSLTRGMLASGHQIGYIVGYGYLLPGISPEPPAAKKPREGSRPRNTVRVGARNFPISGSYRRLWGLAFCDDFDPDDLNKNIFSRVVFYIARRHPLFVSR